MYAYHIAPIDFMWDALPTVKEFIKKLHDQYQVSNYEEYNDFPNFDCRKFLSDLKKGEEIAGKIGWEGDFRIEPHVFMLPLDELEFVYGFAWKQDNNGSTFIISPVDLPWLRTWSTAFYSEKDDQEQ